MNMYQNYYQGMVPSSQLNNNTPKTANWLSAEKRALLQKGISQFKLSVTDEEMAKGQCNHYDQNGNPALIQDADGSGGTTCTICGTHFTSKNYTPEEVKATIEETLNILDTIKIMYLSMDPNSALEYFQIYPFIEKIPQLYNIAVQDFKKFEGVNDFMPINGGMNPFNMFAAMTNPGFGYGMNMMQPQYQQPMYGNNYAYQQPMGMQPQMNNQVNSGYAQQNPAYNPVYGQPAPYQPQPMQQPMMNNQMPQYQAPGYQPQGYGMPQMQQPYMNTNMPNAMNPTGQQAPAQSIAAATTPSVLPTQPAAAEVKADTPAASK